LKCSRCEDREHPLSGLERTLQTEVARRGVVAIIRIEVLNRSLGVEVVDDLVINRQTDLPCIAETVKVIRNGLVATEVVAVVLNGRGDLQLVGCLDSARIKKSSTPPKGRELIARNGKGMSPRRDPDRPVKAGSCRPPIIR
jgi:hypothetical protein